MIHRGLIAILCLAALTLAGSAVPARAFNTSAASSNFLGSSRSAGPLQAPPVEVGKVRWIYRGLLVQPPHRKRVKGKKKMPLYNRYALRTGKQQRASIQFHDGTILHLNQHTDAVLRSPHITYVRGGEVDEVLAPGTDHRIQTPTAVAAAIGTNFDVRVVRGTTRFVVVTGVLQVQNRYGKVEVRRNQLTEVAPNKKPSKPITVQADRFVRWTGDMPKGKLGENIALSSNGGKVVGVSSEATTGAAQRINDGLLETAWTTASGKVADEWIKIGFKQTALYLITAVIIDPAAGKGAPPAEDLKDFEIRVSSTGTDEASFYTVLKGTAAQKNTLQQFTLPPNVRAKYVELYVRSNYGSPNGVGVAELEVVGTLSTAGLFKEPLGLTVDAEGNIFVADARGNRIVKLAPDGKTLATWGKQGTGPGQFSSPTDVKVDAQGNIYVIETDNHRIQKLSPAGQPIAQWGGEGSNPGQLAKFTHHIGIDLQGNVYVADYFNNRIQKFSPNGDLLAIFKSENFAWGLPDDVAIDAQGDMIVADAFDNHIRKLSPGGQLLATWGKFGSDDPTSVALDKEGNIYVGEEYSHRIHKLSPSGQQLATWGKNGSAPGQFSYPTGVAIDAQGNVYVADSLNFRVQKLSPTGEVLAIWQ